jgi:hypothetical protein
VIVPPADTARALRHERHRELEGLSVDTLCGFCVFRCPALTWPSQANHWHPTGQIGDDAGVTITPADDWSPADNPYAIAVSQSQLWHEIVRLTILRMRDEDDRRGGWFSSRQLDAHVLVMTLRQLLTAEQLEQVALEELGIHAAVRDALAEARQKFEDALPGIKDMRDALMHFDEWSRGKGRGPQKDRVKAGEALRDVARDYWRFGYDPDAVTVSFGPYTIQIDMAEQAAHELCQAIYAAAREVDKKNTAERRNRTIEALEGAGIRCDAPSAVLKVSPGTDLRIWLSLNLTAESDEQERRELSERVVTALASGGLRLESTNLAEALGPTERLMRGEVLHVEHDA